MQQQPLPKAKAPCTEPEIIPPGADWPRVSRIWVSTSPQHTTRIKIMRLGPVGIALFALLIGILALAGMALLVGAALVGLAAGAVLILGGSSPASRALRFGDRSGPETPADCAPDCHRGPLIRLIRTVMTARTAAAAAAAWLPLFSRARIPVETAGAPTQC